MAANVASDETEIEAAPKKRRIEARVAYLGSRVGGRVKEVKVKEGDQVVLLGAIMTSRPAVPPKLQVAASLRRGATPAQSVQAGEPVSPGSGRGTTTKPTTTPRASKAPQAQTP